MNKLLIILTLVLFSLPTFSQVAYDNDRFYIVELGTGFTSNKSGSTYLNEKARELDEGSGLYRGRFISGAFVHPQISVGIGAGLEGNYGALEKSTSSAFLDVRLYTKEKSDFWSSIYLYMNYGKNVKLRSSFLAGDLYEVGIGATCFSVGYNLRNLRIDGEPKWVNSITASFVFLFPL